MQTQNHAKIGGAIETTAGLRTTKRELNYDSVKDLNPGVTVDCVV